MHQFIQALFQIKLIKMKMKMMKMKTNVVMQALFELYKATTVMMKIPKNKIKNKNIKSLKKMKMKFQFCL